MKSFTISLIVGLLLVIIGVVFLAMEQPVAAILCLAIGAGVLTLDFKPTASVKDEFSGLKKEELIKKILGIVILLVAIVLFLLEMRQQLGIF